MNATLKSMIEKHNFLVNTRGADATETLASRMALLHLAKSLGLDNGDQAVYNSSTPHNGVERMSKAMIPATRDEIHAARQSGAPYAHGPASRPENLSAHNSGGARVTYPNATPETAAAIHAARQASEAAWNNYRAGEGRDEAVAAGRAYSKAHVNAMMNDPGYARDHMESHLTGARGVEMDSEGVDPEGKAFMNFRDKLYGATGTMTPAAGRYSGSGMKVTMTGKDGQTVDAADFGNARMKMKRSYYGAADPNKTLRQQGLDPYGAGFGVGRNAGTLGPDAPAQRSMFDE